MNILWFLKSNHSLVVAPGGGESQQPNLWLTCDRLDHSGLLGDLSHLGPLGIA